MRWAPILVAAVLGISSPVFATGPQPVIPQGTTVGPVQRVIVKYRSTTARFVMRSDEPRERDLGRRIGVSLRRTREIGPDMSALELGTEISDAALARTLERLREDPEVEFAEIDQRRHAHAVPNDPLYEGQWYLKNAAVSAIDAQSAWDTTTGSKGIVMAVVDTGVRYDHPDLKRAAEGGRLLPGYDFISGESGGTFRTANDGNGRDSDPSDPGDWITTADKSNAIFSDCDVENSSWHGTRVSGIIGALSNNAVGVTGIDWKSWILPVRVLGKCGGFDSDVIAGMRWAAGLHVNGVPDNPYPARIVNMSLGAVTACSAAYQTAIDELTGIGVLVVVSAGNEGGAVDAPANCQGVVGVAAVRQVGTKVGFSSLGPEIALSAPGGNCPPGGDPNYCQFSIDTLTNSGKTSPVASAYTGRVSAPKDKIDINIGTSFSAPIVSGIAALMASVNGNLQSSQLRDRLQRSATPFPNNPLIADCHVAAGPTDIQDQECNCTTETCGAGMANASAAVEDAVRPIAAVAIPSSVTPGQDVVLSAGDSAAACDHQIATYSWAIVDPGASSPPIAGANTSTATVTAPATGSYDVRLTVTDDAGMQDIAEITINPTSAVTSAPTSAGNAACPADIVIAQTPPPVTPTGPTATPHKSGGGGSLDLSQLFALAAMLFSGSIRACAKDRRRACPAHRASHA